MDILIFQHFIFNDFIIFDNFFSLKVKLQKFSFCLGNESQSTANGYILTGHSVDTQN